MFPKLFNSSPDVCNVHAHRFPKEQGYIYSVAAFQEVMHRECASPDREELMKHLISDGGDDKPILKENANLDARTTRIGKIIRSTSLDEIPQLINVLKGEMSLVGPRPPIPYEVEVYKRWHGGRFDSVPGLTGLWQVSGKNSISFKEMARLDMKYSRSLSFWNDLKILFKTPLVIMREFLATIGGHEHKADSTEE